MSDGRRQVADQIPASIGRYQITGSLGYGAMGAVYKAFDPLIKRHLAIKTVRLDIPRSSPQYRSFIERFQHEAQISGTLSHPGIVTLFDLGEDNGLPYFAMEFVDGRDRRRGPGRGRALQAGEGDRPREPGRRGARLRALAGRHPPRHQAGQPDPVRRRQDQGHGLRHREAGRRRHHPRRGAARDAVLHVARAGDGGEARRPQRHLLARRRGLRDALGPAAVPGPERDLDPVQARPHRARRAARPGVERPRAAEVARGLQQGARQEARAALSDGERFRAGPRALPRGLVERPRQRGDCQPRGGGRRRHARDQAPGAAAHACCDAGRGGARARSRRGRDAPDPESSADGNDERASCGRHDAGSRRAALGAERAPAAAHPDRRGRGDAGDARAGAAAGLADSASRSHAALAAEPSPERSCCVRAPRPASRHPAASRPRRGGCRAGGPGRARRLGAAAARAGRWERRCHAAARRRGGACSPSPRRPSRRPWPRPARCAW